MKIFMTGATGYVGSLVAEELIKNGNEVIGLTRSDKSAQKLIDIGGTPVMGTLEDLDILKKESESADAILHLGFINDFDHFAKAATIDKNAIEAIGETIKGTRKPLIVTAGTTGMHPGTVLTENDLGDKNIINAMPRKSESTALKLLAEGVNASIVRFAPSVHGDGRFGLISMMIMQAQKDGFVPLHGDSNNRWNAVNRHDAAHLFVLALDYSLNNKGNLHIFNAVGEGQIQMKDIINEVAKKLNVPVKHLPEITVTDLAPAEQLNVANSFSVDMPADSTLTQSEVNWVPDHIGLIDDLEQNL